MAKSTMDTVQRTAKRRSRALLKQLRGQVMKAYTTAANNLRDDIEAMETKRASSDFTDDAFELTLKGRREMEAALKREADALKDTINGIAERGTNLGVAENAGRYNAYSGSLLRRYTSLSAETLDKVFDKINSDLVLAQFNKTYSDGLKFSRRIWKASERFKTDVRHVIAEGLARGRDNILIARDLQSYVKTDAETLAMRYANIKPAPRREGETVEQWRRRVSTLNNRVSHNVEYNSLRIVRTQVQGAIQDSNIAAQDYVPSVETFNWNLSPAHIVYSICEDIVAANPWTYQTFNWGTPPHPNCLSFVTYNEMPQAKYVDDLTRWSNNPTAPGTEYLNEWQQKYYNPVERGENTNFFEAFLDRTNHEGVQTLNRKAA